MVTVHSIGALLSVSACLWLRTAFAGSQHPRSQLLGAGEKAVVAEWPADALGRAQTIEQICLRLVVNVAKRGKRSRIGASAVIPSLLPERCARVLDQRQSLARSYVVTVTRLRVTVTVHSIDATLPRQRFIFGFGPRLPARSIRAVSFSTRVRKRSSPSGRPMLSAARRRSNSIRLRLVVDEIGEAGETVADRCERSDPVALARKMRAR